MIKEMQVSLVDIVMAFSTAMDLISTSIVDHHKRVAYIAYRIARQMHLSKEMQSNTILAGALHDIGAISLKERLNLKNYELLQEDTNHAEIGYRLMERYPPFIPLANIIRYHHLPWAEANESDRSAHPVPIESYLLNLADRVEIQMNRGDDILMQAEFIRDQIAKGRGRLYDPQAVDAFLEVSLSESFWLEASCKDITGILVRQLVGRSLDLDINGLQELGQFLAKIIDLRSRFTATHSTGVAEVASLLARKIGFSSQEVQMMKAAGYLHDIGKLVVPPEVLEKGGHLSEGEFSIMRRHSFHTGRILSAIPGMEIINEWASLHHERLNGDGYPYRYRDGEIPLGARIMAVADIYTAVSEDRPYRSGMNKEQVIRVLKKSVSSDAIDGRVVDVLLGNWDEIDRARVTIQSEALSEYSRIIPDAINSLN